MSTKSLGRNGTGELTQKFKNKICRLECTFKYHKINLIRFWNSGSSYLNSVEYISPMLFLYLISLTNKFIG